MDGFAWMFSMLVLGIGPKAPDRMTSPARKPCSRAAGGRGRPRRLSKAEAQALKQGPTFRVRETHCGLAFEFYGSTTVLAGAYEPSVAKIARLCHVVIGSADFKGTCQSLTTDFGFQVSEIDDVGRAFHRMRKNDVKIAFGIGRHPPSSSVFLYFYGPDGMTVEYSFGMEEFPEIGGREPRRLKPVPESLDTWGAVPDAMFGKFGAISVEA